MNKLSSTPSANRLHFRAWFQTRMADVTALQFFDDELCEVTMRTATGILCLSHPDELGAVRIMQSTGLTDKNGKEIFEGDILALESKYLEDARQIYTVDWRGEGFNIVSHNKTYFTSHEPTYGILEVIGNIYEHPDLLSPPSNA